MEKRLNFKLLLSSPDFKDPKPELEQYITPTEIVIEILKKINSLGHLSGKVADLGCGTGRISIGAACLGADVTGFEIDEDALKIAKDYCETNSLKVKWVCGAVENIEEEFDTVIMNPPFGAQRPGADRSFLQKALEIGRNIWTIHMAGTKDFIERFVGKNGGVIVNSYEFDFPLNKTMSFHKMELNKQRAILYHIASLR